MAFEQVSNHTLKKVVVLSGAGLSAESGLSTFRDPDGIWAEYELYEVATPEAFERNPELVYNFYNERRKALQDVHPNAAHLALARLENHCDLTIITQNVDDLHSRAGSQNLIHMHGELVSSLCNICGFREKATESMSIRDKCPQCGNCSIRPDVVWFGEIPYHMDLVESALNNVDIFAAIGTSGQVSPANGFVEIARMSGSITVELNLQSTAISHLFDRSIFGRATEIVPVWAEEIMHQDLNK